MTREQAVAAMSLVVVAIVDTVDDCPEGAPASALYAALMHVGISLETFEAITGALVDAGKIKRRGHLFFPA